MDLYNNQNEEISIPQLASLFHEVLPKEEIFEYIYQHSFIFKRNDELLIRFSFLDFETHAFIFVYKNNRVIAQTLNIVCSSIKVLDEENKIFELTSPRGLARIPSTTVLSLNGSPVVRFFDYLQNSEGCLEVDLTDLMVLFDDFDEKQDRLTNEKYYCFFCRRNSEMAELTVFPRGRKVFIIMRSNDSIICEVNLVNCNFIRTDSKNKKVSIISGYDEFEHYIICELLMDDHIFLHIDPYWAPWSL